MTRSGVNNFIMSFLSVEFRAARLEPEDPFRASYIEVSVLRHAYLWQRAAQPLDRQD